MRIIRNLSTLAVNNSTDQRLRAILEGFDAPIRYCVAYGSGVYPQAGKVSADRPLVDFIFGVTHTQHWHSLNLRQYPQHYASTMKIFGSRIIESVQDDFGAKMFYNTNCMVNGEQIKYGVISITNLLADLEDWETLYCAGRLQKPVKIVQNDARVQLAQKQNLESALRAALLILPQDTNMRELFYTITQLSYTGDFRMRVFGDNPDKVKNIVDAQMDEFERLYLPIMDSIEHVDVLPGGRVVHDMSEKVQASLVRSLPKRFKEKLLRRQMVAGSKDAESAITDLAASNEIPTRLKKTLAETIFRTSISQALKGIITAGLTTSMKYAARKLKKGWKRSNY